MEVILRIVEGPDKGREFRFQEADNFLIGRQDPTSRAHLNLSPEDLYVSRHHFTIEVRPPNCLIRDNGSSNGTYLCRRGVDQWERTQEALVENGDRIKVGRTILEVEAIVPEPESIRTLLDDRLPDPLRSLPGSHKPYQRATPISPAPAKAEPAEPRPAPAPAEKKPAKPERPEPPKLEKAPAPQPRPSPTPAEKAPEPKPPPTPVQELLCIRCGIPLPDIRLIEGTNLRNLDFMCKRCREAVEVQLKQQEEARAEEKYTCFKCHSNVTSQANADGRAAELRDSALYLCKKCAQPSGEARGQEIGGYRLLKELGRGGMGVVYQGWHPGSNRLVAIKQLLPLAKTSESLVLRFLREASIMEALHHPGLVWLYESGLSGENPYFISEFAPDGNLNQYISSQGAPTVAPRETAQLIASALEALDFVHEQGFVHRDLKPENILLRKKNGQTLTKLADFGLARSYEGCGGTITRTGEYAGTILYMPPEQILEFKKCKPPVDVYAMGVTLYYLLSGRFPLNFPPPHELQRGARLQKDPVRMILEDPPCPLSQRNRQLPARLCAVVDRSVEKEVGRRYQTAGEFRAELIKAAGL